jgi:Fe-S-cluster containining protein
MIISDSDRIFYSDGYRLGQSIIAEGYSEEAVAGGIEQLYSAIDGLIDSLLLQATRSGVTVDCTKGCAWCCHQPVFANNFELQYLTNHIRLHFPPEKVSEIMERAKAKNSRVASLNKKQMLNHKSPCPLLENDACLAYKARPMACRIYLATQVDTCVLFFKHPESKDNFPALLQFPLRAGQMLNEGFTAALKQHNHPVSVFRIEEGLYKLL